MAKTKRPVLHYYKEIAKKHRCFAILQDQLYCLPCSQFIKGDVTHISDRAGTHIKSKRHKDNEENESAAQPLQLFVQSQQDAQTKQELFCSELTRTLAVCKVPLYILDKQPFVKFLQKYTGMKSVSRFCARVNEMPKLLDTTISRIRSAVGTNDIFIIMDETVDRCDRSQVNVIIGVLDGNPFKPMLLNVEFIDHCNSATIVQVFISACVKLWQTESPPYERVKLLMSDQASYMLAAGQIIKGFNKEMLHVTCLAHCLSRVAESVRDCHPKVNEFLSHFKEVLRGSRQRKLKYREVTKLQLPPKPIITRWTTWLQAARYAGKNLDMIKKFSKCLKSKSTAVNGLKQVLGDPSLLDELVSLSDYYYIIEAVEALQTESLRLDQAWNIVKRVGEILERSSCRKPDEKFEKSIEKNPDLKKLFTDENIDFRLKMKYAPVVSADVERSFSVTKKILAHDRCSFTELNLKMHYVIAYNSFLTE